MMIIRGNNGKEPEKKLEKKMVAYCFSDKIG